MCAYVFMCVCEYLCVLLWVYMRKSVLPCVFEFVFDYVCECMSVRTCMLACVCVCKGVFYSYIVTFKLRLSSVQIAAEHGQLSRNYGLTIKYFLVIVRS